MTTFHRIKNHLSQILALQLLADVGYQYLTPEQVLAEHSGWLANVLLGIILRGQLKKINRIHSKGDKALFGYTTEQMKNKWNVPKSRALADFAPTIVLKAKDFATEITIFNAKSNQLQTEREISGEHITNNESVRNTLIERGIRPENLPPDEDVKKVERKLKSDAKKGLKNPKSLD